MDFVRGKYSMKAPVVYSRRMRLYFHLGVIEFELLFQDKNNQKTKNTFLGGWESEEH